MDATQRFSDRVENYIRYRPGYPREVVATLAADAGLAPSSVVADIGSGTGISSEIFLKNGNVVYAVEPNAAMRAAAETLLGTYPGFHSVAGTAEATTLEDRSADFIVAGQAFHWFDPPRAREEFARIARPGGWIVLLWNTRRTESSPFLRAYEELLLRHSTDYAEVNHANLGEEVIRGFLGDDFRRGTFANQQIFDWAGLKGRLLSSSYAPPEGHPKHEPMIAELDRVFRAHQEGGTVRFEYDTEMFYAPAEAR